MISLLRSSRSVKEHCALKHLTFSYDADGDLNKAWKNIRRPFRGHLLQGQMYLELAKRMSGAEAPTEIVFLYELKSNQAYKEFTIKADYEVR